MDVGAAGLGIIETHLDVFKAHESTLWPVIGLFVVLSVGFLAGVAGIETLAHVLSRRETTTSPHPPMAGGEATSGMAGDEIAAYRDGLGDLERRALRTAMVIAVAIGLHNFAEGLAIGVSAQAGDIGLATVLIIGFALHNSTEGFGIVGPLGAVRPSWRWLLAAGLVAGGPTFVGSMVGYQVTSDALELCFYALSAGAILYVLGEIWAGVRRFGHRELGLWMLGGGFVLGIATDLVVAYGGA
jgi:zinc transporter, ZIP family